MRDKEDPVIGGLVRALRVPVARYIKALVNLMSKSLWIQRAKEDSDRWSELRPFFKNLRYETNDLMHVIDASSSVCAVNPRETLSVFLTNFPSVSPNMSAPALTQNKMENSIFAKMEDDPKLLHCRMAMCYVLCEVTAEFFLKLFQVLDASEKDGETVKKYTCTYQQMLFVFLDDTDKDSIIGMKKMFWRKWAAIFNLASRVIPLNVLDDFAKLTRHPFSLNNQLQDIVFRIFSQIHISSFQPEMCVKLCALLTGINIQAKAGNKTVIAFISFLRNLLGFALQSTGTGSLVQEIRKIIARVKAPEKLCFNSALVLFHTLTDETDDIRFIFDVPTTRFNLVDMLNAFCAVMNGKHYLPECELNGSIDRDWKPRDCDCELVSAIMKFVKSNPKIFVNCQEELANFMIRCFRYDPKWFIQSELKGLSGGEFFALNTESVMTFVDHLSTQDNCAGILSSCETARDEFMNIARYICQFVFDYHEPVCQGSLGYRTNFIDENNIVETTIVMPILCLEGDVSNIECRIHEWGKSLSGTVDILKELGTVGNNECVESVSDVDYSITSLQRALSIFPSLRSPDADDLLNKVSPFLFSSNSVISAITMRALEKYTVRHHKVLALDAVLKLKPRTVTEWYVMSYATFRLARTCFRSGLVLDNEHAQTLFAWNLLFMASPCQITRSMALLIADTVEEWTAGDDSKPVVNVILSKFSDQITETAMCRLFSLVSMVDTPDLPSDVTFVEVLKSPHQLLYHIFFSSMLLYASRYVDNFLQLRDLVTGIAASVIESNGGSTTSAVHTIHITTVYVSLCTSYSETMASIMSDGLTTAESCSGIYLCSLAASLNTELPCSLVGRWLEPSVPARSRALAFALHCRMRVKNCEKEINEFASVLKNVIEFFLDRNVFRLECMLQFDAEFVSNIDWQYTIYHIVSCIRMFSEDICRRYGEQKKGTLLRRHFVARSSRNSFGSEIWFAFMYNALSLPYLRYHHLLHSVVQAFVAYSQVVKIPKSFRDGIRQSISWLNVLDVVEQVLDSAFEDFLPRFILQATKRNVFFQAICNQFVEPSSVEADLTKLKRILHRDKVYDSIRQNLGSLVSLGLYYFTSYTERLRRQAFKLMYHMALFVFVISDQAPVVALNCLEDVRNKFLSSSCQVPTQILLSISEDFASCIPAAADAFADTLFRIVSRSGHSSMFLPLAAPWFEVCTCDSAMLQRLVTVPYKSGHVERKFVQFPIACEALPLVASLVKNNSAYILNCLLDGQYPDSKGLLLYICFQHVDEPVSLLVDHLKFEYWLFEKQKYARTIDTILGALLLLFEEECPDIKRFSHYIYGYCFCASGKVAASILTLIDTSEFSTVQTDELVSEALKWAVSCGDASTAKKYCRLVQKFVTEKSDARAEMCLNAISTIVNIFQESQQTVSEVEIEHIAALLELAYRFSPNSERLVSFVFQLIKCNQHIMKPLFNISLDIFNQTLARQEQWDDVFASIITASCLDPPTLDKIHMTFLKMIKEYKGTRLRDMLTLAVAPYLMRHMELNVLPCDVMQELTSDPYGFVSSRLIQMEPQKTYAILNFYIMAAVADTSEFNDVVCRICHDILLKFDRVPPVTSSVFRPLITLITESAMTSAQIDLLCLLEARLDGNHDVRGNTCLFPDLKIEATLNPIPWIPLDMKLMDTPTANAAERQRMLLPTSQLMKRKELLAHARGLQAKHYRPFNYTEIMMRIDMFLNHRRTEETKKCVTRSRLFAFKRIDVTGFKPSFSEINKFKSNGQFPMLMRKC